MKHRITEAVILIIACGFLASCGKRDEEIIAENLSKLEAPNYRFDNLIKDHFSGVEQIISWIDAYGRRVYRTLPKDTVYSVRETSMFFEVQIDSDYPTIKHVRSGFLELPDQLKPRILREEWWCMEKGTVIEALGTSRRLPKTVMGIELDVELENITSEDLVVTGPILIVGQNMRQFLKIFEKGKPIELNGAYQLTLGANEKRLMKIESMADVYNELNEGDEVSLVSRYFTAPISIVPNKESLLK